MKSVVYPLIVIFLRYIEHGGSYPTGAPNMVCGSMMPNHYVPAQSCLAKYMIQSDKLQYSPNEAVRIIVNGSTSSDLFRGILLVAITQAGEQIVGTWSVLGTTTQTLGCNNVASTGITHNSPADKSSVQAVWTPPSTLSGSVVVIRATVVTTKSVFYVNCFNVTLTARQSNQSTNATSSTAIVPSSSGATMTTTLTTTAPQTDNVGLNVNWTYTNGMTTVRMRVSNLKTSQWCGLGLSTDRSMGEDHVFMCKHLADGTVVVERLINPTSYSPPVSANSMGNAGGTFSVTSQRFADGVVFCEFTLSGFASSKRRRRAILPLAQSTSYYPLIAIGNLDSSNNIIKHTSRQPLNQTVQLDRQVDFSYNADGSDSENAALMKAHGIIMIFTWILFVSTGILTARYFKTAWPERKICGKAIWFAVHRVVMISVAILTIVGFILILVYEKGKWVPRDTKREFAHSIVGILVVIFAVIQPFMALFRCHPGAPYRFIFNYLHATVGLSALVLSVVAIFLAMFFTQFNFEANKQWGIVLAWACWLPVIFVAFQMIEVYFKRQVSNKKKTDSYDLNNGQGDTAPKTNPSEEVHNPTKDRIKAIALSIHILVALGLSLALASLVGTM